MSRDMSRAPPVLVALTPAGAALARRLAATLPGAQVHGRAGRVDVDADATFEDTGAHLRALFAAGRPIVGVCAAGVLIRALAPALADKTAEPPVVAIAEDGSAVVPLVGGHRGANDLARVLAVELGVGAAITTAGDLAFGLALDDPPPGWRLANREDCKGFTAALLAGARARLDDEVPALWLRAARLPLAEDGALMIHAGARAVAGGPDVLVYHPAALAVGVGCARGAPPAEAVALAREALAAHDLAPAAVGAVVSIDLKADEPAVHAVAAALGVPARFYPPARLEAERPRLANPSDVVFREVGCHGVTEGAALAAAGPAGALVVPKVKSAAATCAVARAPAPLDPFALGRGRGRLRVVGLGPGDPAWRAPEATQALGAASDIVGYGAYLDLLGDLATGKALHPYDLGAEEARVRAALDLAAEGREVALVSSGDPGIYAMASLVFEVLERAGRDDWRRVELSVVPGISALQAAAARLGAPLGHDFCAISLSDLLTPWPVIEGRLSAAAAGDFVVALYNPVSRRRTRQLAAARDILRTHRPGDTPVAIARNLGRPGESVAVMDLDDLTPARVDMLSLVLIGSSQTRRVARGDGGLWVYTPRGYTVPEAGAAADTTPARARP